MNTATISGSIQGGLVPVMQQQTQMVTGANGQVTPQRVNTRNGGWFWIHDGETNIKVFAEEALCAGGIDQITQGLECMITGPIKMTYIQVGSTSTQEVCLHIGTVEFTRPYKVAKELNNKLYGAMQARKQGAMNAVAWQKQIQDLSTEVRSMRQRDQQHAAEIAKARQELEDTKQNFRDQVLAKFTGS